MFTSISALYKCFLLLLTMCIKGDSEYMLWGPSDMVGVETGKIVFTSVMYLTYLKLVI